MKRILCAFVILLFLIGSSVSYAVAEPAADASVELPMKDDGGKNWVLQNEHETYRVKWSFSSDSPYDHFEGMKINDHTVVLRSFEQIFAVNESGQILWNQNDKFPQLIGGADDTLFTVSHDSNYLNARATVSNTSVTRMDVNGNVLNRYTDLPLALVPMKDADFIKDLFYTGDWKGNFVALLDKGLVSLRPDGSSNWQLKELKINDKSYDVYKMTGLIADKKGNLLVGIEDRLLCVNADNGAVVWAIPHTVDRFMKLSENGLLKDGDRFYEITKNGLEEVNDPRISTADKGGSSDHQGGFYEAAQVNGVSTLMNKNMKSGQVTWSFTLDAQESAMGYNMAGNFDQNLVSDPLGNVYVSTNGGAVHSLDPQGNPRFSLMIRNRVMSFSQIIPIAGNAVVITNNNHVVCLEKVDKQNEQPSLWINGQEKQVQNSLFFENGRVMIALREIFEMLGATVTWEPDTSKITAVKGNMKVVMQIGSKDAEVNGRTEAFDAAPKLVGDVAYVPIRFVSETLGSQVDWDGTNQRVHITTDK